MIYDRYQAVK